MKPTMAACVRAFAVTGAATAAIMTCAHIAAADPPPFDPTILLGILATSGLIALHGQRRRNDNEPPSPPPE